MIRSTTDEMLAARFDPEPWVNRAGMRDSIQDGALALTSHGFHR